MPPTSLAIEVEARAVGGISLRLHEDVERVAAEIGYWLGRAFWRLGVMTAAELEELLRRFQACELPRPEWTHAAHLSVGLWHASRFGRDDALTRLRAGIRRLNESNGVVNSPSGGYHETITWAYVQLLVAFAERHAAVPVAERVTQLLAGPLAERSVLLKFYSRARLEAPEARLGLIEPDLAPLDLDVACNRQTHP